MWANARKELWGTLLDGRYRLHEPIGAGATGVVFAANRLSDGRSLAIKVLRVEHSQRSDLSRRLRWEAQAGSSIHHPGVVPCLGQGTLPDGSPYVVFERLAGESLLRLILRRGPLPLAQAIVVGRRVARVLAAVHSAGYVHRDLKPEHIWLSAADGVLGVSVIDFGVCQPPETEPARSGHAQVLGTPGYLAPEQAAGAEHVNARSDLYGLGATLFEALTGCPPFSGPNAAVLLRLALSEDPPPLGRLRAGVPRALERVIESLLARDPEKRPLNARSVERALVAASDTPLTSAEAQLVAELQTGPDRVLAVTLDESRPTRELAASAG